jgi:alginate O-acetyltransferase complex protein AlgI
MLLATWWYLPFLSLTLVVYWLVVPVRARRDWLTAASLFVMTALSWQSTLGFVVVTGATYTLNRLSRAASSKGSRRFWFGLAAGLNIAYLATFKYLPLFAPPVVPLLRAFSGSEILLPIGVSYFTFRFIHYLIESQRGTLPPHDWWDFLAFASFFCVLPAGPIERFQHLVPQFRSADDRSMIVEGLQRIFVGTVKKLLIADFLVQAFLLSLGRVSTDFDIYSWRSKQAWLLGKVLYLYFDFSGYSDIAIGTGLLFGIKVTENFNYPLLKTNLSEYWRAWHMSLTSWCRDYVYFPVFGLTRNPKFAAYASMAVLGAWHGTHVGWLVWGAWQATGLALWQYWVAYRRSRPWLVQASQSRAFSVLAWGLTINWVALGAAWTAFDDLGRSLVFIRDILTLR